MYTCIWEYRVRPDAVGAFVDRYGPSGAWAILFRRGDGHLGTDLYRDTSDPARFLTIDRWISAAARREFRLRFATAYEALDRECEAFTTAERLLHEIES